MRGVMLCLLCSVALTGPLWAWHMELAYDGGGYWRERVLVEVENLSSTETLGALIALQVGEAPRALPIAGQDVTALRVCDELGRELKYDLRDAQNAPRRKGKIEAGDGLSFRADLRARQQTRLFVYVDNPRAWPVAEFLDAPADEASKKSARSALQIRVSPPEKQTLQSLESPSAWPNDLSWQLRIPLTIHNFSDQSSSSVLIHADLRKALWRFSARPNGPALLIVDGSAPANEAKRPHLLSKTDVYFLADLPARCSKRFDVYISKVATKEHGLSYEPLIRSRANRALNPSFEEGDQRPTGWQPNPEPAKGFEASRTPDGQWGRFAARLRIPPKLAGRWLGWRQEIPAKPDRTYAYFGFVKADASSKPIVLHAHWLTARHQPTQSASFLSTDPGVVSGEGWARTSVFRRSPPDTAFVELLLTTDAPGTFWYDGIFFGEVHTATVGLLEARPPAPSSSPALRVWAVNPLIKVFPDSPPEDQPSSLPLCVARNEWEPLQIALRSGKPLRNVQVEVSALRGPKGQTLPRPELWRVGYVPVDYPSAYYRSELAAWYRLRPQGTPRSDGWSGEWPDPLIPFKPFDLPPDRTEAIWLLARIPPETNPGLYEGTVRVSAEREQVNLPVHVRVLPVSLPAQSELQVIFDLRNGRGWDLLSDKENLRTWYRFLSRYRLSPGLLHPSPTFRYENGQVRMETEAFDEMAHHCLDELGIPVLYTPNFLYAFGWAYTPKRIFGLEPFTPEYNRAFQAAYRAFFEHVREKGWFDRFVYYISDEPHFKNEHVQRQMKQLCDLAHEAEPKAPIYSSVWQWVPEWEGYLDIWGAGPHGSLPIREMERLKNRGDKFWFTTDGHMCIDTPYLAIERLLPYLAFKYGASGYEFWGVSWWTYDPWERGWHSYIRQSNDGKKFYWVRYPDGDGYLAYPGERWNTKEPLPSIRLVQVREGIEDYHLFRLLQKALDRNETGEDATAARRVLDQVRSLVVIPNKGGLRSTDLMPDPEAVSDVRRMALETAAKLMAGDQSKSR